MAPDISSKLVDKLNNLNWLHNSKRENTVRAPNNKLCRAPKSSADCDRASAVLCFLLLLSSQFLLIHCGFHDIVTAPLAVTG